MPDFCVNSPLPDRNNSTEPFSAADLPLTPEGVVYHLNITRQMLANDILLVGDPGRTEKISSEFFESTEYDVSHRGLRTITGTVKGTGQRVSVVTSGMGTPSLEIALNELMILNEIDPVTRTRKANFEPLNIIRVGTSGLLQSHSELGVSIITSYAVGLDNTGLFFSLVNQDENSLKIEQQVKNMLYSVMDPDSRFYGKIHPYATAADSELLQNIISSARMLGLPHEIGITTTSSGFNANQGRDIGRMRPSVPDIDLHLSKIEPICPNGQYLNMEMESSFLLHFAAGHGYKAASICAGIANRRENTFATNYEQAVLNASQIALKALELQRMSNTPRPTLLH